MEQLFSALAEPNRLKMIELLRKRNYTVGELADLLKIRQPQASNHLKVLRDAGLVKIKPVANQRIYILREEPFVEMDQWVDSFRNVWEEQFDRLDGYLQDLQRKDVEKDQS